MASTGSGGGNPLDMLPAGFDLCQIPAATAPGDEITDFNDPGLRDVTISVTLLVTIFAVVMGSGRLCANFRKLNLSDYFVFMTILCNIGQAVAVIIPIRTFRHQWDVRACWMTEEYLTISYIWQVLFVFGQYFAKTATLMMFYQIFVISSPMRMAIRAGIVFTFVFYALGLCISSYFSTPHVGQGWDQLLVPDREGGDVSLRWAVVQGSVGLALDIYIFVLPLPMVARLKLSTKKKIQVTALFFVAVFGVVAAIVSLIYRTKFFQDRGTVDSTYNTAVLMTCNVVEMNVALIVCSTPACAGLFRVHVLGAPSVKRLRAVLGGTSSSASGSAWDKSTRDAKQQYAWTDGSVRTPRRGLRDSTGYFEVDDSWRLPTGTVVDIEASRDATPPAERGDVLRVVKTVDVAHTSMPPRG